MKRALVLLVLLAAPLAHADKADKLFQKAKKLHGEKKYAEACPTFEEVDKIDPGIGAKLNTAKCYEDWGRLATAHRWYSDAEAMATTAKDARVAQIKQILEELDTNVPRVTIKVPEGADPDVLATLTMDGQKLEPSFLNSEQRVDPGPHVIEFVVNGQKKKKLAPVERGGESEVSLDIPKGTGGKTPIGPSGPTGPGDPPPEPPDPGKTRRYLGIGLAGAGGVALAIAVGVTLSARGDYKDALSAHCMGSPSTCNDEGLQITGDARSTANKMTVLSLFGAAAIAGGVVLYLAAPKAPTETAKTVYVSPVVDATGGGLVLGGTF